MCDNLCFSGLISLAAKHTKNVIRDLPQKTFDLFGKLEAANLLQDKRIGAYKERAISTTEVHDFLVRSVDEKSYSEFLCSSDLEGDSDTDA